MADQSQAAIESLGMSTVADKLRGYEFLPAELVAATPRLYETEAVELPDKLVTVKFFCPVFTWYVFEVDQSGERAFGYIDNLTWPPGSELGYIDVPELRQLWTPPLAGWPVIYVDRDLDWTPARFGDIQVG